MRLPFSLTSVRKAAWHLRHGGISELRRYRLHQNSDITHTISLDECQKFLTRRPVGVPLSPLRPRIQGAFLQRQGIAVFTTPSLRDKDIKRATEYALVLGFDEPVDVYIHGNGDTYEKDGISYPLDALPLILHGYKAVVTGGEDTPVRRDAIVCETPVLNDDINLEHWRENLDLLGYMQRIDHCVVHAGGTISVVIATNRPHQLTHVLAALAEQTRQADEIFIGTHGFSADVAMRALAQDLALPVTWKEFNSSYTVGGIFGELISLCSGTWIAKMDDDDMYGREYLADALWLGENTSADVIGKNSHYVYLQATDETRLRFQGRELINTHLIAGPTIVVRRSVAEDIGYPALKRSDDTTFITNISESGGKIVASSRFGFVYMRHANTHNWAEAEATIMSSSIVVHSGIPDNRELPYDYGGEVML